MDFSTFERRALEMWAWIPDGFKAGVTAVVIGRDAVPDPEFPEVFMMGHCSVDEVMAAVDGGSVCSILEVHYGSFAAMAAKEPDFPWDEELWETLTHELRHHMEWRAGVDTLGDTDDLEREDLNRRHGRPFLKDYYRHGLPLDEGVFQVDELLFIELVVDKRSLPVVRREGVEVEWAGIVFGVEPDRLAEVAKPPWYAGVSWLDLGEDEPEDVRLPWGAVTVVVRKKRGWFG